MTNDDVSHSRPRGRRAQIVAIHFETVSHATETRADLRARLTEGLMNVRRPGGRARDRRPAARARPGSS